MRKTIFRSAAAALMLLVSLSAAASSERQRAEIESRIAPVGKVCLQGDSSCLAGASPVVAAAGGAARSGEAVYNAACMACHMTGAGGAPITGDEAAWADRIGKGLAALHDTGINGVPGTTMMARGGCMSCSDEEVIAAVDYMVSNSGGAALVEAERGAAPAPETAAAAGLEADADADAGLDAANADLVADAAEAASAPAAPAQVAAAEPAGRSGEAVYTTHCLACHMTGAGGSPVLGNQAQWADRIAQGMDVLYDHGINGMPGTLMMAKGGCGQCSDAEIRAAVDHMVEGSR